MAKNDPSNRLIGNDGAVYLIDAKVAEVTGDDTKTLDELVDSGTKGDKTAEGFYKVVALASTTSALTGLAVGDYFYNDGSLVLKTGDKVLPIAMINKIGEDTSIKGFEISLTRDKTELTTMSDTLKTYRMGKADASGTMTGITTVNEDVLKNKFLDVITVSNAGAFTKSKQNNTPIYFVGFLNADKDVANGTLVAVVGRIDIESGNLGATVGNAQEFSAGFAPFSGDKLQVINIETTA